MTAKLETFFYKSLLNLDESDGLTSTPELNV